MRRKFRKQIVQAKERFRTGQNILDQLHSGDRQQAQQAPEKKTGIHNLPLGSAQSVYAKPYEEGGNREADLLRTLLSTYLANNPKVVYALNSAADISVSRSTLLNEAVKWHFDIRAALNKELPRINQ